MKERVEAQSGTRRCPNMSDYVRDLIGKDQMRGDKIAVMQRFVDDGLQSGKGARSQDDLFAVAIANVKKSLKRN